MKGNFWDRITRSMLLATQLPLAGVGSEYALFLEEYDGNELAEVGHLAAAPEVTSRPYRSTSDKGPRTTSACLTASGVHRMGTALEVRDRPTTSASTPVHRVVRQERAGRFAIRV